MSLLGFIRSVRQGNVFALYVFVFVYMYVGALASFYMWYVAEEVIEIWKNL